MSRVLFARLNGGTLSANLGHEFVEAACPVQKLKNTTRLLIFETHGLMEQVGHQCVALGLLTRLQKQAISIWEAISTAPASSIVSPAATQGKPCNPTEFSRNCR